MIIELFGPPAAGKTTFARALAERLEREGRPVRLVLSLRPAEVPGRVDGAPSPRRIWATARRIARPALEFMTGLGQSSPPARSEGFASQLLDLLPLSSVAWSLRLSQYIARLENSWRLASQSDSTVIFDQGFVQCLCSLVLLAQDATPSAVAKSVALIPKADQWFKVEAPRELLRARLEARRSSQSWCEQRFELDVETSLRSIEILSTLESLLPRHDSRITRIGPEEDSVPRDCRADAGMDAGVDMGTAVDMGTGAVCGAVSRVQ